jgi:hypothetical protein
VKLYGKATHKKTYAHCSGPCCGGTGTKKAKAIKKRLRKNARQVGKKQAKGADHI